jgi:hypothetical protein
MGVIPIQEDSGQELYTRDHGTVKIAEMSFQDGGYHIVLCPNGTYMHSNGLPIKDEKELRAAIPPPFLEDALNWFQRRHEDVDNPPRPIGFNQEGLPVFGDGSVVTEFDDLYAYFKPGPILTAAIVALTAYKKGKEGQQAQAAKKVQAAQAAKKRKAAPKSPAKNQPDRSLATPA